MPIKRGHVAPQNTFIDNLIQKFDSQGRKFLIANAVLSQNPIIFCNDELCYLCGYTRAEIIRRSAGLEFLYGPLTSSKAIQLLKHALTVCEERSIVTILYNKSGDHFVCQIAVAPVRNAEGQVRLYILTIRANSDFDKTRPLANGRRSRDAALVSNCRRILDLSQILALIGLRDVQSGANRDSSGARASVNRINEQPLEETTSESSDDDSDRTISGLHVPSSPPAQPSSSQRHASLVDLYRSGGDLQLPAPTSKAGESLVSHRLLEAGTTSTPVNRGSQHRLQAATLPQMTSLRSSRPESTVSHCVGGGIVVNTDSQTQTRRNVSEKVVEMLSLGAEVNPDHKLHAPRVHSCTLIHYGPGKAVWDWLILFLVIYTAIVTPFSVAFLLNKKNQNNKFWTKPSLGLGEPLVIIDAFVDIMFIIDIIINFRTTYVNKNDELVSHPCRIAVHYAKGWLLIDVVAAIPFEFLYFGEKSDDMIMLVGLMKTARLLRLVRVVRKLDRYSEYGAGLLFLLMLTFILIAHWLACVWYAVGNMEHENQITTGWLDTLAEQIRQPFVDDTESGPSTKAKYITALYFTFSSLTSVGFGNVSPNTDPEKLFSIFVMLLGSLMYAGIFGHVSAVIQRLYSGTARYHTQMLRVKEFIRFHQFPNPLKRRLEEFFQHAWSYTNGIDMNLVLRSFPECLQADICLHLNRNLLSRSIPFKGASQGCLRSLALKLKTTHVPPGDTLLHRGDILCFVYFIARGSVEILMGHELVAVLCQGDVFGESPFDRDVVGQSRYYVRTLTYCDLHKIQQEDILETLDMYPEFRKQFRRNLEITFDLSKPFKVATCDADTTAPGRPAPPQVLLTPTTTAGVGESDGPTPLRASTSYQQVAPVRREGADVYQVHWATNATESASSSMSFIDAVDDDYNGPTEQCVNRQHQLSQDTVPLYEHRYMPSPVESVKSSCVDCPELRPRLQPFPVGQGRCEQGSSADDTGPIWSAVSTLYGRLGNVEKHINQLENKLETDLTQILHLIRSYSAAVRKDEDRD